MSLDSTLRRVVYQGDGKTKAFPFRFKVFASSDVVVQVAASGETSPTTLGYGVDYTVALNADQENEPGGTVTTVTAPENSASVAVISGIPETQPMVLTPYDGFNPETLNTSADRSVALIQQLSEKLDRAVTVDATDTMTPAELKQKLLDVASRANDLAEVAQKAAEGAQASEAAAKESADSAAKDAATTADNLREVQEIAQTIGTNLEESADLLEQTKQNAENAATSAKEADSSASAAAASAELALQASKNAGYSVRYCERLEANSTMDIAALTPSANAKAGDHVVNAAGDVFEILSTTALTFVVGDVVTNLQGPEGPQGTGLELSDAFATIEDLLAAYPSGYPGQTVLVGNKIYVWSETTESWTPSESLTVTERAPDYIPWSRVTEKPALVEFDEYDKRGTTLDIQSGMTYTVIS